MGIADLLAMLQGGGQMDPSAGQQPPAPQGVGALLGGGDTDPGAQDQATPAAATMPQPAPAPVVPPAAPAPITPPSDAGSGGLSGFLQNIVQKATNRNDDTGMSFMDKLGRFGGQMTDMMGDSKGAANSYTAAGQNRVDQAQANDKAATIAKLASQLGMTPREKLMFAQDPGEWVKANASRLGFHDVSGGNTGVYGDPNSPDTGVVNAPKYGVENGEGYAATPDSVKDTGGLAQSPQQAAETARKEAVQASLGLYHQKMAKAAQDNAAAHMASATRPRVGAGGGGGGLPPGYVPR